MSDTTNPKDSISYEEIEKKLIDDDRFSADEKLFIIRALENFNSTSSENAKNKKFDYDWFDHSKTNVPASFPNWDYTKGPTC